jgi:hypothetical protein
MNTVLVIMVLLGSTYEPMFVIHYQTEAQCQHRVHDYQVFPNSTRKAVCVSSKAVKMTVPDEVTLKLQTYDIPSVEVTEK